MAIRKPLVLINGEITTLPAADTIQSGQPEDVGVVYDFRGVIKNVPLYFQYLVSGRIILDATSVLRVSGQAVII